VTFSVSILASADGAAAMLSGTGSDAFVVSFVSELELVCLVGVGLVGVGLVGVGLPARLVALIGVDETSVVKLDTVELESRGF